MRPSHAPEGEFLLVTLDASRIDAAGALAFKDEMRALPGSADVLLDRARVTFVDSSGLGAIVATMKALAPRRLHLAALNPTVAKVFRLTRMDTVFPIHASVAEALHAG